MTSHIEKRFPCIFFVWKILPFNKKHMLLWVVVWGPTCYYWFHNPILTICSNLDYLFLRTCSFVLFESIDIEYPVKFPRIWLPEFAAVTVSFYRGYFERPKHFILEFFASVLGSDISPAMLFQFSPPAWFYYISFLVVMFPQLHDWSR